MTSSAVSRLAVTPTAGIYILDPTASRVAFTTRHMFGLGAVAGTFALTSATVAVGSSSATSVTAEASSASFSTGNARRDTHVRSEDFLGVENHPAIAFRSDVIAQLDGRWVVSGVLTVRGVEAPLELTVTDTTIDGDAFSVTATGTVDRYAHGLVKAKGMAARSLALTVRARFARNAS